MQQELGLEQLRNDKIKALGFVGYNLYVDGALTFPEINGIAEEVKGILGKILALRGNFGDINEIRRQEEMLDTKLTELGCICYNLYIDKKLFNDNLLSLCDAISSINFDINNVPEAMSQAENDEEEDEQNDELYGIRSEEMEPIPMHFKQCICGYRNKPEANFCGKCGTKL